MPPDLLVVNSHATSIPSSTNPTNLIRLCAGRRVPMTMVGHRLNYNAPEDVLS